MLEFLWLLLTNAHYFLSNLFGVCLFLVFVLLIVAAWADTKQKDV